MKVLFLLICIAALYSCRTPRYVYAPSAPSIPFFKRQGDSKISAGFATDGNNGEGEKHIGWDFQAAYAITDHFAITTDYFSRKERDIYQFDQYANFDSSTVDYRRRFTSFGAGYFIGLTKRKKITFNIYGGVGFGKFTLNDHGVDNGSNSYNRFYNARTTKWYLRPGLNFMPGTHFWCSVNTGFAFVHYGGATTSYDAVEQQQLNLAGLNKRTLSFFEPSYNMVFAIPRCPWLKLFAGFTVSANMNTVDEKDYEHYDSRAATGSIGLSFDPSKIHAK